MFMLYIIDIHTCITDTQNAGRIVRALFEIALRKGWPLMTGRLLQLCKIIDRRMWPFASPLRQFPKVSSLHYMQSVCRLVLSS